MQTIRDVHTCTHIDIEREKNYFWVEGTRAELKAWKAVSVGTGIEPQRKPTGFGRTISNLPTHWSSRPPSELGDDFSIDNFSGQSRVFLLLLQFLLSGFMIFRFLLLVFHCYLSVWERSGIVSGSSSTTSHKEIDPVNNKYNNP